ncbi:MAG: UDP-N-acetylmuramoyl-tripeptide--D-alanyl-D-alanine ligase [Acidimicrobiia bacterium]
MRFLASDVAAATRGRLVGPDLPLDSASFDSRSLAIGQLFVPIVADRDGHDFIAAALAAGAGAYLTAHEPTFPGGTAIVVEDTATALLDLARWGRSRLPDRVVGVTGSVGKTSVKDLTAAVLRTTWRTAANERSYNNDQGLPVTILGAPDDVEVLVLEMGMRGFGEIARLCDVARPTIGVVTNVAEAHSQRVGGIEGVARAKGELVEALPATGTAILNAAQPLVLALRSRTPATVLTFGEAGADVRAEDIRLDRLARAAFTLVTPDGSVDVALAVSGAHMVPNACAAAAVGFVLDVPLEGIAAGLATAALSAWRMEISLAKSGAVVINDAYNANPTSMRAALDALLAVPAARHVAVLGVMAEITEPEVEHRAIAAFAAERGIELVAVGTDLYGVPSAGSAGEVELSVTGDDAVLVKGSRVAGLERLAARLLA